MPITGGYTTAAFLTSGRVGSHWARRGKPVKTVGFRHREHENRFPAPEPLVQPSLLALSPGEPVESPSADPASRRDEPTSPDTLRKP
jgi:hypothetical protein